MKDITITKDNGTTHRLINSDFLKVLGLSNIDAIITDTPYGTIRAKWDCVLDLPSMWAWMKPLRKPTTPVLLFAQLPYDKVLGCSNIKELKYEWVWEKTAATGHLNAKKMPMKAHEVILTYYNKLPLYNPQKTSGHKPTNSYTKRNGDGECYGKTVEVSGGGATDRYPRDVLKYASDKQKINLNATQKPLALLRYLIRTYTNTGDTVLDFTAGSCALAVACFLEGRNSICIEMDEGQFNKSVRWVENCSEADHYNKGA